MPFGAFPSRVRRIVDSTCSGRLLASYHLFWILFRLDILLSTVGCQLMSIRPRWLYEIDIQIEPMNHARLAAQKTLELTSTRASSDVFADVFGQFSITNVVAMTTIVLWQGYYFLFLDRLLLAGMFSCSEQACFIILREGFNFFTFFLILYLHFGFVLKGFFILIPLLNFPLLPTYKYSFDGIYVFCCLRLSRF